MARLLADSCRLWRTSISFLPSLVLGALLGGGLFAGVTLLSLWSPLRTCGDSPDQAAICTNRKAFFNLLSGSNPPLLTIFTAPARPFGNSSADPQYQALLSWLTLQPTPKIVLLGKDPSYYRAAEELSDAVSVEPNVDYNLWGSPHVHSMFARAQQERTYFSMIIDPEILLLQDTMDTLQTIHHSHDKWVLFGNSRRMDMKSLSVTFTNTGTPGMVEMMNATNGFPTTWEEVADFVVLSSPESPVSYWAWNNLNKKHQRVSPLLHKAIPPFSYVKGTFENWFLWHFIEEAPSNRFLVDASEAITSVRIASNLSSVPLLKEELRINKMLLDEADKDHYSLQGPWKLMRCTEPTFQNLCLVQQSGASSIARDLDATSKLWDPLHHWQSLIGDSVNSRDLRNLDMLLPIVADKNKVVVMTGCTSNYKEMLLSFICKAQSLGIQNVLIAAFDEALFEFAYLQGLPVYLVTASDENSSSVGDDIGPCIFASECFKHVSKLKSMSVLRVLKKGYHVLWSDSDITWFENPLPKLLAFEAGTLLIQSDEPDEKLPENSILGANSGFYLAHSDAKTVRAFETIVKHAMQSETSEQPSFYTILCGANGERRVGKRECFWEIAGLRTIFLGHEHYPNGNAYEHWSSCNATASCEKKGCVVLHNNFIKGTTKKIRRFVENGLWFYDMKNRMCMQPWYPLRPPQVGFSTFRAHFSTAFNLTQSLRSRLCTLKLGIF